MNFLFEFSVKIALFHSNVCTSNTPSLPQTNISSLQSYTPVTAKFRYPSFVSLQAADTTTVKPTSEKNFSPKSLTYIVSLL